MILLILWKADFVDDKLKHLKKDLINKFSIRNGAKKISGIFQNYLVFISAINALNILVASLRLICGSLMEPQKKILKL